MMLLLQQNPEYEEKLRRIREELRARGIEPDPLYHVRQPFDYYPSRHAVPHRKRRLSSSSTCFVDTSEIAGVLEFLRAAEKLKNTHRSAWTSGGQPESVAEHTWRLCLMALVLKDAFPEVDFARLVKMCIIHDLGEAIGGDIPAIHQVPGESKAGQERADLLTLLAPLPERLRAEIVNLWDEYEAAATPEARVAKALDKLETIMQHNQGANPPGFDYAFNLDYGKRYTTGHPLVEEIRAILDTETARRAADRESIAARSWS